MEGVKLGNSSNKKVDINIVKDESVENKKTQMAQSLGILKYTLSDFIDKYLNDK